MVGGEATAARDALRLTNLVEQTPLDSLIPLSSEVVTYETFWPDSGLGLSQSAGKSLEALVGRCTRGGCSCSRRDTRSVSVDGFPPTLTIRPVD